MAKKIILSTIILGLLLAAIFVAFKPSKPTTQQIQKIELKETVVKEENSEINNTNKDTVVLNITSPNSVSYKVQKQWFNKDAEEVVGKTTTTGQGTIDKNTGDYSITIKTDLKSLSTGSDSRDKEVVKLFTQNEAVLRLNDNLSGLGIEKGGELDSNVDAELTINGITKIVNLQITGTYTEKSLKVAGETTFDMNNFNITPPNLINVYKVAPEVTVEFTIQAEE
jgi:polyisoprenoid-binding protein YceI